MENKKKCCVCGKKKKVSEFYFIKTFNKPQSACKKCQRDRSRKWQKDNHEKFISHQRATAKEKFLRGQCNQCSEKRLENSSRCEFHYIYRVAYRLFSKSPVEVRQLTGILVQKLRDQKYQCPYTSEKLVLGLNTHLDHIKPKSKFPKLIADSNNLEWVFWKLNVFKGSMTREQFIGYCRKIGNRKLK